MHMHKIVPMFLLAVSLSVPASARMQQVSHPYVVDPADKFRKTELYFGTARPDGTVVTEEEWQEFLLKEVTPRFPNGFTVIAAAGQYRTSAGQIVREHSRVIIIFYPKRTKGAVGVKVEEIRKAYCDRFKQESVMRVDSRHSVEVDF